jgi:hypothetical protein
MSEQPKLHHLAIGLIMVGSAAAAVGCGGSAESAPLTKKQFVREANAICADATAERASASKDLAASDGDGGEAESEEAADALVAPVRIMSDELADLQAPRGDARAVGAIVAAFEAGAAKVEADPVAPDVAFAFARADRLALEYGLAACLV